MSEKMRLQLILEAVDKASAELDSVRRELDGIEKAGSRTNSTLNVFTGLITAAGIAKFGSDLLNTTRQMQGYDAALVTATGSQQAANREMERLQEFAKTTPYQLGQVLDAYIKLKNFGLDPSERALRSYGNTTSALNKDLNQMIEAVADAVTGEFERLKDLGIKTRQQGDTVRFTFRGITTEVKNSAEEIQEYLLRIGEVDFAGGMERQMVTMNGSISNLEGAWSQLLGALGNTEAMDTAQKGIDGITGAIDRLRKAIAPTQAETLADLRLELQHTMEQLEAAEKMPGWMQMMYGGVDGLREKIKALRGEIAALEGDRPVFPPKEKSAGGKTVSAKLGADSKQPLDEVSKRIERFRQNEFKSFFEDSKASVADSAALFRHFAQSLELTESPLKSLTQGLTLYDEQLDKTGESVREFEYQHQDAFEAMQTGLQFWAADFTETILDATTTGKFAFGDFVTSVLKDLARLAIQQNITNPLFSAISSGLTGLWNGGAPAAAPSTFEAPMGNFNLGTPQLTLPAHHGGGSFKPKFNFGGLKQDEGLAVLLKGERVFDPDQSKIVEGLAQAASRMGGAPNVTMTFHIDAGGGSGNDTTRLEAAVERAARKGYQMAVDDVRSRGAIYKGTRS